MMTISRNLQLLLELHNINESELARHINLPRQTINKIITGIVSDPKSTTLLKIAHFFNISVDQLLGNPPSIYNHHNNPMVLSVPILQDVTLNLFETLFSIDNNKNIQKFIQIETATKEDEIIFAINLEDNSMFPKFKKGVMLIFSKNEVAHDKAFVFAYVKRNDVFLFRQMVCKDNHTMLLPLNVNFPIITLEKEDKIIGKLIKIIKDFDL